MSFSKEEIKQLSDLLDVRFKEVDQRLDGIDQRFDGIDQRFDGIDRRFDGVDQRFDGVDQRFDAAKKSMNEGFKAVDAKFVAFSDKIQQSVADTLRFNNDLLRQDMKAMENRLTRSIEDGKQVILEAISGKLDNHEKRIVKLELGVVGA